MATRQAAYVETEAGLQDAVVEALRYAGYTCLQVGRWRRQTRCPSCGVWHTPKGGWGNDTGTPDVLVGHSRWGAAFLPIELKKPAARTLLGTRPAGKLRPEQRALHEAGLTEVCYSVVEVFAAVERMNVRMKGV